jgi:DNA-binding NarL/FixJ family response regulator
VLRVLVVEPVRFVREGLVAALGTDGEIDEVVAVEDLAAAIDAVERCQVALVDAAAAWAASAVAALAATSSSLSVVAIGVSAPSQDVAALAAAGAVAYVTSDQGVDELRRVVLGAAAGAAPCSPSVARALVDHIRTSAPAAEGDQLTAREVEVLGLIQRGLSNKEIARTLVIGLPTVKHHVHNILHKLGARTRSEAARRRPAMTPV